MANKFQIAATLVISLSINKIVINKVHKLFLEANNEAFSKYCIYF